ncbi:hypothetical protein C8R47DRAFT_1228286, partial [Mycena vitilis]
MPEQSRPSSVEAILANTQPSTGANASTPALRVNGASPLRVDEASPLRSVFSVDPSTTAGTTLRNANPDAAIPQRLRRGRTPADDLFAQFIVLSDLGFDVSKLYNPGVVNDSRPNFVLNALNPLNTHVVLIWTCCFTSESSNLGHGFLDRRLFQILGTNYRPSRVVLILTMKFRSPRSNHFQYAPAIYQFFLRGLPVGNYPHMPTMSSSVSTTTGGTPVLIHSTPRPPLYDSFANQIEAMGAEALANLEYPEDITRHVEWSGNYKYLGKDGNELRVSIVGEILGPSQGTMMRAQGNFFARNGDNFQPVDDKTKIKDTIALGIPTCSTVRMHNTVVNQIICATQITTADADEFKRKGE